MFSACQRSHGTLAAAGLVSVGGADWCFHISLEFPGGGCADWSGDVMWRLLISVSRGILKGKSIHSTYSARVGGLDGYS